MNKSNFHKKATHEDHFTRYFACEHRRINYTRFIKHYNNKKLRRIEKAECNEAI